jgi:glycosyltransferase involved in cell wall biosynthesis
LWEEPAGLVVLEAMAAGTPIVAYEAGGLTEYIKDGGGGIAVKPVPRALSEGIRSLSSRPRWQELSERGRKAAATIYSPPRYVAEVLGIYRSAQTAVGPLRDA